MENALDISAEERHVSEGKLEKGDEVYILGTRLDDLPEEEELSTQATLLGMLAISPGKKVSEKPAVCVYIPADLIANTLNRNMGVERHFGRERTASR